MPRQRIRQQQSRKPDPVDDQKLPSEIADEITSVDAQSFLGRVISQIRLIIGTEKWSDAVPLSLSEIMLGGGGGVVSRDSNGLAPQMTTVNSMLVDDGGTHPVWRPITTDDVQPGFNASLSSGGTLEIGALLVNPAFTASYTGGAPTSAQLSDTNGNPPVNLVTPFTSVVDPHTFTKTVNNATVTFTLSATKGAVTKTPSVQYVWRPRVYWGIGALAAPDSAFVNALAHSVLASARQRTLTMSPVANRMYYAIPIGYGMPTFTIGPFTGGWSLLATVAVTNAYSVSQSYDVWVTDNDITGDFDVVVT